MMRQLSLPQPPLFPPNPLPQQHKSRMIHKHELFPPSLPSPHPHPQFVALKSLIVKPP